MLIKLVRTKLDLGLLPSFHLYPLCTEVTLTSKGSGNGSCMKMELGNIWSFRKRSLHTIQKLNFYFD